MPITVTADFPGGLAGNGHAKSGDTGWARSRSGRSSSKGLRPVPHLSGPVRCARPRWLVAANARNADRAPRRIRRLYVGRTRAAQSFDTLLADFQAGKAITVCTDVKDGTLVKDHCYAVSNVYRDANGNQWVGSTTHGDTTTLACRSTEVRQREIYTA